MRSATTIVEVEEVEYKTCTMCGETKDIREFRMFLDRGQPRRRANCIVCAHAYQMKWRQENPDKVRAYNLRNSKAPIGMSVEEFGIRLGKQNGVCMICRKTEKRKGSGGKPKRLAIDHDHGTGENRDLLCDDCNNMIGRALEDPEVLRAGAEYLERWGK